MRDSYIPPHSVPTRRWIFSSNSIAIPSSSCGTHTALKTTTVFSKLSAFAILKMIAKEDSTYQAEVLPFLNLLR